MSVIKPEFRPFYRLAISQKYNYPILLLKYASFIIDRKKDVYKYVWEDFQNRKHNKVLKKRRYKLSLYGISRFIENSLRRRSTHEQYLKRKVSPYLYIDNSPNLNKTGFIPVKQFFLRGSLKRRNNLNIGNFDLKTMKKYEKKKLVKNQIKNLSQVKPTRLITRFRNLLAKKGNLAKAEYLVQRVRYILKLSLKSRKKKRIKFKRLLRFENAVLPNKVFFKVLSSARPIISLKPIKKGKNNTLLKPIALSLQRSTSLGQRNIIASVDRRSERSIINRIAAEFISIYKKKPNSTQTTLFHLRKEIRKNYALL